LAAAGARGWRLQGLIALLALGLSGFAIRQQMAGAADWFVALGVLLAAPELLATAPERGDDLRLGLGAALAAATKVEGVVIAGLLVVAYLLGQAQRRTPDRLATWLRAAAPAVLVTASWLLINHHFGLRGITGLGTPDLSRAAAILRASAHVASLGSWQGLPLVLLALPWVLVSRSGRRLGAVVSAQLVFYFFIYFAATTDPTFYVLSTLPRLLVNVIPATLIGLVASLPQNPASADESH
jgi:4-amino-4-deoxy-L-arabinose transferase-like glycosyltransferase